MKIVVIGGTGLIGTKLSAKLGIEGHDVAIAAPQTGVNTITGKGLEEVVSGASTVVDVSNSPTFDDDAVLDFFRTSTMNVVGASIAASVEHYVVLSVVGTDKLQESGYFRAKQVQEDLVQSSSIPYSIVHATQFFEFLNGIADGATEGDTVRLAPVLIQPIAADDVALTVSRVAETAPLNGLVEVAGPEEFRLDQLVHEGLQTSHDPRKVVADHDAKYFGATLSERVLLPGLGALIGSTTIADWRAKSSSAT